MLVKVSHFKQRMDACCSNSEYSRGKINAKGLALAYAPSLVPILTSLHCGQSTSKGLPPKACMYRYRTLSACKMGCSKLLYVLKNHGYCSLTSFKLSPSVQSLRWSR